MENLWDRAEELLAAGKPFVLATIIRTRGSVPRVVGVDLTGDFDQDEIQVCGGLMDVALDLWRPEEHRALAHALAEATQARRPAALVTAINPVDSLPAGAKSCLSLNPGGATLTPSVPL